MKQEINKLAFRFMILVAIYLMTNLAIADDNRALPERRHCINENGDIHISWEVNLTKQNRGYTAWVWAGLHKYGSVDSDKKKTLRPSSIIFYPTSKKISGSGETIYRVNVIRDNSYINAWSLVYKNDVDLVDYQEEDDDPEDRSKAVVYKPEKWVYNGKVDGKPYKNLSLICSNSRISIPIINNEYNYTELLELSAKRWKRNVHIYLFRDRKFYRGVWSEEKVSRYNYVTTVPRAISQECTVSGVNGNTCLGGDLNVVESESNQPDDYNTDESGITMHIIGADKKLLGTTPEAPFEHKSD